MKKLVFASAALAFIFAAYGPVAAQTWPEPKPLTQAQVNWMAKRYPRSTILGLQTRGVSKAHLMLAARRNAWRHQLQPQKLSAWWWLLYPVKIAEMIQHKAMESRQAKQNQVH